MEITGTQTIAAPRSDVWHALNDPETLKRCLPGCESVERTGPDEFRIVVTAAIGPLRARFNGMLRMTEALPPESCVMVFEGQGGTIGFGKGSATVHLQETAAGTELAYTARAQVGGKLAQVGARLIDNVARKMSDDFFKAFKLQVVPAAGIEPAETTAPTAGPAGAAVPQAGEDAASSAQVMKPAAAQAAGVSPLSPPPAGSSHIAGTRHVTGAQSIGPATTMVPGWWLAVAVVLGAAATVAGGWLVHG